MDDGGIGGLMVFVGIGFPSIGGRSSYNDDIFECVFEF